MSFDFTEFDARNTGAYEEAVEESEPSEDELEVEDDVAERIDMAQHYRTLLVGSIFQGEQGRAAALVTKRIREFADREMRRLLGLLAPEPTAVSVFDDEEIRALKAMAARLLQRDGLVARPQPQPQALQPRLVKQPPPRAQVAQPPAPAKTTKVAAKPKKTVTPIKAAKSATAPELIEEAVSEDGKTRRLTKQVGGRVITQYLNDEGKILHESDRTPQIVAPTALPPLSPSQLEQVSAQHANESAAAVSPILLNLVKK